MAHVKRICFNCIVPGRVYRSGQLSPQDLDRFTRALGIRTVINLRGFCPGLDWYREEGLDVKIVRGQGSADTVKRIAAGQGDERGARLGSVGDGTFETETQ